MPKTIKLESHLSSEELENHYRKARDPVLRSHYQILWLISEGKTTTQVMEVTGYSRGWIQQLARRYNSEMALRFWETVVTKTRVPKRGHCSLLRSRRNSERH